MISGDMCKKHGWAHSIAHASDTFEALVNSPKLETLYYEEILQTLLNKVCVHSIYYKYEEDERIVYPNCRNATKWLKGRSTHISPS